MKVIQGSARIAFLGYFVSHIPITLFVDGQGLLGPYYPQVLVDVVAWYSDLFGDVLMKHAPSTDLAWFSSFICCEILFQFPFFFAAIKFIGMEGGGENETDSSSSESTQKQQQDYPEWFRMGCIVYGTHVSTTLVPILATFLMSHEMTVHQKCATIAVYSPYLIFPFWLMWLAVREDVVGVSCSRKEAKGKEETKLD